MEMFSYLLFRISCAVCPQLSKYTCKYSQKIKNFIFPPNSFCVSKQHCTDEICFYCGRENDNVLYFNWFYPMKINCPMEMTKNNVINQLQQIDNSSQKAITKKHTHTGFFKFCL